MVPLSHCLRQLPLRKGRSLLRPYIDTPNQLPGAAIYVDARLGHARAAVRVKLLFIAIDGCRFLALLRD